MKKSYQIIFERIIYALIFVLILSSCMHSEPYHRSESPMLQVAELNDIHVECLYLDRNDIIKRHGLKENPFLAPSLSFTPRQILIFELNIFNNDSAPLRLDTRDVNLYFNNLYKPLRTIQMDEKIVSFSDSPVHSYEQNKARQYMLPNVTIIPAYSSRKGYIVFMAQFQGKGKAELVIDFTSEQELPAGEFKFDYDLIMK